jgi:Protein of unknown function (DUF3500)
MVSRGTYRGFKVRDRWIGPDAPGIALLRDREGFFQRALNNAGMRATEPFKGITADGELESGLFALHGRGDDTSPLRSRAIEFLDALPDDQRHAALRPVDSPDWQRWSNAFEAPHGASLLSMTDGQRLAALAIIAATLSRSGYQTVRDTMRLNETLGELVGNIELLGEWNYAFHIYGSPRQGEPWGWQIHGHHLILSCLIIGNQIVMTPAFIGAEPTMADTGKFAGTSILGQEEAAGLSLINSLSTAQQERAVLFGSIRWADLPPERVHPADGRHQAGAFKDNLILPYEGLPGSDLSRDQKKLLLAVIETYINRMSSGHASVKMEEIRNQIDRTYLVWMGGCDVESVFYYRIYSPVVLIEFDQHHGVFLDNDEPEKFHTHTIVRTPNGNDYGRDILRQHLAKEHAEGSHKQAAKAAGEVE